MDRRLPASHTSAVAQALSQHIHVLFSLCCRLEQIADSLPSNVDRQECLCVARSLYPLVRHAHEFEESQLFPVLMRVPVRPEGLAETIERLKCEHWEDECYAEEIRSELLQFVQDPKLTNIETLGYMLRGFFESLRRHIAFEREHVLPLLAD